MGRYNHLLSLDATIMVSKKKTAQSLVNTLSFSLHKLPQQQCYMLKTPLIADLGAYIQKRHCEICYMIKSW